jgi:hypothetical protein
MTFVRKSGTLTAPAGVAEFGIFMIALSALAVRIDRLYVRGCAVQAP